MGDRFEKIGELLSQKIQEEEEGFISEKKTATDAETVPDVNPSEKKISPELLLDALKNKPVAQGEVVPSGSYEEDVPVKIITGEAEFK